MSANCPNQADVRAELATLLQTKLVDNLDIVNEVHPSLCALTGKTTVMVEDAGIERLDDTLDRDSNKTIFYFKVYVFVPFGEDQAGWNAADAANHRNLIEKYIADCLIDNVETDFWHYIAHDGRSDPDTIKEGEIFYKFIQIPVVATNFTQ